MRKRVYPVIQGEMDVAFDVLAALRNDQIDVEGIANEVIDNPTDWTIFIENLRRALERRRNAA